MDMIKEYESDSLLREGNVDIFVPESNELDARPVRRVKQRQAARTPNVVFVVASHNQNFQIVVLLLQTCLFGSLTLSCTLLLQPLQWLQQDRRFRLFASLFSCCLKTDSVASCLRERWRCFLNSVPVEKTVWQSFYILIFAV